jgi:filamentous hemagglutinin family protein
MKSKINLIGITSLFLSTSFLINALQNSAVAQITATPNDAGTMVNQSGNQLNIQGGTEAGKNLFHSFEKFGVNKGQTANFISKPEIENILGRVTGGDASVINGLIQVTGGNSNLYLMNPAGIIFGADASLNVPAAFTATTGNGIGFGDKWFNAFGTNDYAELIANPDAFAFTQAGAILNDGNLAVKPGQNLTLLGGSVINTRGISAPGGSITVKSVSGEKVVRITQPGSILSIETRPISELSSLPNNWTLPISTLPELLTGGVVTNATGLTISGDEVKLTGSGLKIENGDLVVNSLFAKNATLSSSRNLVSLGKSEQVITTSENLNLLAQDTVNLLESTDVNDFLVLQVGGNLKVQGNQNLDIKLSNDKSILQTGGNLNLVSDGTINADARFVTGGNFSVQNLSGGAGNFSSSFLSEVGTNSEGIISSNGDVNFGSYEGSSLKVEAKGNINVDGDIKITQPNASLVGTDSDIPILKNNSSLILRAGLSELRNTQSPSLTSVEGTTFENTDNSTTPGNITVNGNIIIKPSSEDEILGSTTLEAKSNINVNGNISIGNFELNGSLKGINSPLTLNSSEGSIAVTGDIEAGNTTLSSLKDINVENIEVLSADGFNTGTANDFVFLSSQDGKITVNTIWVPFGSVNIEAGDVFQAKGTISSPLNDFSNGINDVPVSIIANQTGNINIQHSGVNFTNGLAVNKDAEGNIIFRVKADRKRVFLQEISPGFINFVDEDGNTVTDIPIIVERKDFDISNVSSNESFTTGLIVAKGGVDAGLYGAFGDTFLDGSADINVVGVPKPDEPTPDGEVVQRQLNKEEQSSVCTPQNSTIAVNTTENTRGVNTTNNSQSTINNPCTTTDNNNILKVTPDNRINSNSALPTSLFELGKQ